MKLAAFLLSLSCLLLSSPGCAGDKDKPEHKVLSNPAKDIFVVSDRDETVPAFFQRRRIIVGNIVDVEYAKLKDATKPLERFFVNYSSHNDDASKRTLFGDFLTVAPMKSAVVKLIDEKLKKKEGVRLVLERDAKDKTLYHVVGCLQRNNIGFFMHDERSKGDDFSPRDLLFKAD